MVSSKLNQLKLSINLRRTERNVSESRNGFVIDWLPGQSPNLGPPKTTFFIALRVA